MKKIFMFVALAAFMAQGVMAAIPGNGESHWFTMPDGRNILLTP